MQYQYNNFNIHDLGDVAVSLAREAEGGDAPQRTKVTLRMTVDIFQRSYDDNYQLVAQLREALRTQQAVLKWHNDVVAQDYVNQTASLVSHDLPEEWGEYHQRINLVFVFYEQNLITQNVPLELQRQGSLVVLRLSHVTRWNKTGAIDRFDNKRPHRRETKMRIAVSGTIQGDPRSSLAARRTALAAEAVKFRTELNGAEAILNFGAVFSGTVRVESFEADVDQSANQIGFSFTASYTAFPDEGSYATCEVTADLKDGMTGETFLTLAGKIQAATEAQATTKLEALRAAFVANYGYDTGQLLQFDQTPNRISANSDGDTFTELTFTIAYRTWRASNQGATFLKTGDDVPISFGHVRRWDERYSATRFSAQRSQRNQATGHIEASGTWAVDPALSLTTRRSQLLALKNAMLGEVNCADGTLTYGDWTQTVRVSDLRAEVNQAETGIEWSFSAEYSLFPDEGGYATCEFSVDQREEVESGDKSMTFSGKILAPNGALARAKLNSLRSVMLGIYGWNVNQRLKTGTVANAVEANGDKTADVPEGIEAEVTSGAPGITLIELSFSEEYRARITGSLVSKEWTISAAGDISTGITTTSYQGSVTAAGSTHDGAYATALAAAAALGAGKEATIGGSAYLKRSTLTAARRQTTAANDIEFVRLTFNYEYESKVATGNAYLEAQAAVAKDTFGMDTETVTGFVVASSFSAAQALYASEVRTAYNGQLVRNETVTQARTWAQSANATHELRVDFSFQVFTPKAAGKVALRYSISVTRDLMALTSVTNVRGSAFADTAAHAALCVDAFFGAMSLGALTRTTSTSNYEHTADYTSAPVFSNALSGFTQFDFEDEYRGRITGDAGVIEMRLTEEVRYSATRWAVQQIPYSTWDSGTLTGTGGISIPQPAGVQEGMRTVRGSVSSASLPTATAWARRHLGLLTGDDDGGHYELQPVEEVDYDFVPRIDGIAADDLAGSGTDANVQLYRVNFTYGEILPNYFSP